MRNARAKTPPRYALIKKAALALPGVSETFHHGPWFTVGAKSFVNYWEPEKRWIFKLPKDLQEMYFDARGDIFQPMTHGALRWSYVAVEALKPAEIRRLVTMAWRMVATRKLQRELVDD